MYTRVCQMKPLICAIKIRTTSRLSCKFQQWYSWFDEWPTGGSTILTYLLTPWCRVLLEKPTGLKLVKKFPAFHGTRRFITALTSVHQLSLSWASPIQSIYPHPTSWRSILILPPIYALVSPVVSFPPVSPPRPYTPLSPHPYAPHAQPISFFSILSPAQYWVRSTNHLAPRYAVSTITIYSLIWYSLSKNYAL